MKIILIYLPHPYLKQPDSQIPLGLLYLATILENQGVDVELKNYTSFYTHEAIADLPEADMYGITAVSVELPQANRFAHLIKEVYPNSVVGVGGPGTITEEYIDWNSVDFICKGEAEKTILEVVHDFESNKLKKIYIGDPIVDLDTIPFPNRNFLKSNLGGNVFAYNKQYKAGGSTVLITARGCPFNCAFCANVYLTSFNKGLRYRSPKNVYDEIVGIVKNYGVHQIRVSDDLFTFNDKRTLEICNLLQELDVVWRISARVKPFSYKIAKAMYDSGCREISFGVESFDNNVLSVLNKRQTALDAENALKIAVDAGIKSRVLLMIRTPGQTERTVPINIEWLEKVPYNVIACTVFVPMPGSDVWYHPERYGVEIINKNLDDYNFYFFNKYGENDLTRTIKIIGRDPDEVDIETSSFYSYLKSTGRVNKG